MLEQSKLSIKVFKMNEYHMQEIHRIITKEKYRNKNQNSKINWKPEQIQINV